MTFINGEFLAAASERTIASVNPSTEEVVGELPDCDESDVDRAVTAARRAFDVGPWGRSKPAERAAALRRIGDGIRRNTPELARIETLDSGKPLHDNINADIPDAVACFEHFAGWTSTIQGSSLELPFGNFLDYTTRKPYGVVGAIAPWNFPLVNAAWKIAPALATGNCIVYKPSEETSLSTLLLARIIAEADLPAGVVNIVTGSGEHVGAALSAHPGVDKLSFTGSTDTGRRILHAAAELIKPALVELGGKSANIIFDDANLDAAVEGAAAAIFFNAGQVCTAGSRLFVAASIYEDVKARLIRAAENIRIGDPLDRATRMGPIATRRQFRRILHAIEHGSRTGARLLTGGGSPAACRRGFFVQPSIFENVALGSELDVTEIFGPVLALYRFETEDQAIALANSTPYGLAAGIWTRNLARAHRCADRLHAGTVWVNCYNVAACNAPNPGRKMSGIGSELGREGFEAYTQLKNVCIDLSVH